MKSALALIFCALAIASAQNFNTSTALLAARGIVEGISEVKGWGDISSCISTNEAISTGLADSISMFNANDSATYTPAAMRFGTVLQKLPVVLSSCNNSIQIAKTLARAMSSFSSVNSYVQIILNNLNIYQVDLAKLAYSANTEYTMNRTQEFGNRVGKALALIFLNGTDKYGPKPDSNDTSRYLLIAQGVVEGIGAGLRWSEISSCIRESRESYTDIANAVELLQRGDPVDVAQGLAAIGQALQDIPAAFGNCKTSYSRTSDLVQAIASIQDAATYLDVVGENVILNGVDIYDEIYTAVQAFNVGAWKNFGTNIGLITSKTFLDNISQ